MKPSEIRELNEAPRTARGPLLSNSVDFDKFVGKVARMTDENRHGEARLAIAKYFGATQYVKIFTKINELHEAIGHAPMELLTLRTMFTQELFNFVAQAVGKEKSDRLRGSL